MKKIKFWWKNARPISLPQSLTPAILALVLGMFSGEGNILPGILAVFGVSMAHLSCNMLDDYFDYKNQESGYRESMVRAGMRARTQKCRALVEKETTLRQWFIVSCIFGSFAVAAGLVIVFFQSWQVLIWAGIGAFLGYFYSARPLCLGYHGLGELVIGIVFGPLSMIGVYQSATGGVTSDIVLLGVMVGSLVVNILYTHSVLDCNADLSVNKITLAVLAKTDGRKKSILYVLVFGPYILLYVGMALDLFSVWYMLVFLSLPLAVAQVYSVNEFLRNPEGMVTRKKWYGPIPHWDQVCAAGLDWFLLRWCMARNLVMFFGGLCMISCILEWMTL